MKQFFRQLFLASMFALVAVSQAPPVKTYRISGVVVDRATNRPLARVRIVMNPAGEQSRRTETTTGPDGQFAFEKVAAGMWSLYAEGRGFPRQGFGERPGVPDSFTQVVVGPAGVSEGLIFPLDAPAVVTGKITDEDGEPVLGALEIIARTETGIHTFQRIRNASTDEHGEFRLWDLPAVPCYLLAVPPPPPASDGQQVPPTLAAAYYPNTSDPQAARMLDLQPGQEYKADFVLRRVYGSTIHIEGEIGSHFAMLSAEGPQGAEVVVGQLEGRLSHSFFNVPPGRYKLTLYDPTTNEQSTRSVEVGTADVTVQAPFGDAPMVRAEVQLVDADPVLLTKTTFYLHADGDYQTHAATVAPDGSLTIPGMSMGRYKFMIATPGLYIKSLTHRGTAVADRIVDVPETGTVDLDIVVAGNGGEVAGYLRLNGKPVAPARVVLAPRQDSTNFADYKSYQTETDGSFRYRSVPPGDYVLFGTSDWNLEFGNPAAIRKHLASGKAVHVAPKSTINVAIQPFER